MATRVIENGLTSDSGADSFITSDLITTGAVIWVDSVGGSAGGAGTYEDPVDDLAQAHSNATADNGDIIVIKSGHTETLTSAITITKSGLKIFGLGTGSSAPNFTVNAAINGIDIQSTANSVEINNLYFPAGTTATNTSRINVDAAGAKIKGCTFLCGQYDANTLLFGTSADYVEISSCSFTVSADGPNSALLLNSTGTASIRVTSCSFNGANIGWDDGAIYGSAAFLNFVYDTVTLTNGADIIHSAAAKGFVTGLVAGDECQVNI